MKNTQVNGAFSGVDNIGVIPKDGFMRLAAVLTVIPVSKTAWQDGIRKGIYPAPVKLSARSAAYRVEDIRKLIAELGGAE
ncbi:MAG: hypothetical protein Q9M14_02075 [Mariprofundaceae bacterium]|nr:hypothetical protein [Mariprofundaceae bacterium]